MCCQPDWRCSGAVMRLTWQHCAWLPHSLQPGHSFSPASSCRQAHSLCMRVQADGNM